MNKTMKIITILLLAIMLISIVTNVFAADGGKLNPGDITATYSDSDSATNLKKKAQNIVGMLRNIAVIASVIIITILGVKYMLGSVEEKAEYKKSFMPLIIGIIVVVGATQIAAFIFGMAE